MQKIYQRINWENDPSTNTPLNEDNLNKMDYALDQIDDRVVNLSGYEGRVAQSEENAKIYATNAKTSENNAKTSADNAKQSETKAKEYMENAFNTTPEGYAQVVEKVELIDIAESTDYDLYNSKKGGYRLNEMVGNTEQKQLSGKNKLNYEQWKGTQAERATAVYENNGVTLTSNGGDAYTYSGDTRVDVNEGDTVIISWEESTNASGNIYIFPNGSTTNSMYRNNSVTKRITYTVPSGVTYIGFRFGVANSGTTISYKNIMITVNDDNPTFEPWCGGTPSPNPSFPQAIENTFDCVEMIRGAYSKTSGVYITDNYSVCSKYPIPCKSGDSIKSVNNVATNHTALFYNGDTFVSAITKTIDEEIIAPSGVTHFKFYLYSGNGLTPQTVGKITLTANEKHIGQFVEHGKNFFSYAKNDMSLSPSNQRTISIYTNKLTYLPSGKYYVVVNDVTLNNSKYGLRVQYNGNDANMEDSTLKQFADKLYYTTFNLSDENILKYLYFYLTSNDNTNASATFSEIMIVSADTDLSTLTFEPYTEKVTTCYLNEPLRAEDRIFRKDGVIGENHKRGSVKASELTWNYRENVFYTKDIVDIRLCTHFRYTTNANITSNSKANELLSNGQCARIQGSSNDRVYFKNEDITSLDDWNAWIVENDFEIEYPLAEETYTPLDTASQLALNDMETFDGVTYIEVDSKIPPTSISGEYGTSQVGAYTLKAMNVAENNAIKIEDAINTMLLITP